MKLHREIEKATGIPRNSTKDAVARLLNLKYSNLEILKMAQESQAYGIAKKIKIEIVFNMYVSALTVRKKNPQATATERPTVAAALHPGHSPVDPTPDQPAASADGAAM